MYKDFLGETGFNQWVLYSCGIIMQPDAFNLLFTPEISHNTKKKAFITDTTLWVWCSVGYEKFCHNYYYFFNNIFPVLVVTEYDFNKR